MPDEQERRASKRPAAPADANPTTPEDATSSAPAQPRDPQEPVDFKAAAQRLASRAAHIADLKAAVERGEYQASADETARAMERRSDS